MRGSDGFSNADLAGALFHGDQHDVHDADAADQQRDEGDQQEHDRERERNIFCGAQDGGERLHVVFGARRVPAVENLSHLFYDGVHLVGALGLRIKLSQNLGARVVLHQREGNDDGFVFDFGEAEGRDALTEHADDGEAEFAEADGATDRIVETEDAVGDLLGNEADLAALLHVGRIEVAAPHDYEATNRLIAKGDADEVDRTLATLSDHRHRKLARAGDFGHPRNLRLDGVHIIERQFVAERRRLAAGVDELDVNHVGADRFNLADDVFLAGEGDGYDENDRGAADDDAERSQNRTQLIGAEGIDRDGKRFAQVHHGYNFFRRLSASEAVRLLGSSLSAASYSLIAAAGLFSFS